MGAGCNPRLPRGLGEDPRLPLPTTTCPACSHFRPPFGSCQSLLLDEKKINSYYMRWTRRTGSLRAYPPSLNRPSRAFVLGPSQASIFLFPSPSRQNAPCCKPSRARPITAGAQGPCLLECAGCPIRAKPGHLSPPKRVVVPAQSNCMKASIQVRSDSVTFQQNLKPVASGLSSGPGVARPAKHSLLSWPELALMRVAHLFAAPPTPGR